MQTEWYSTFFRGLALEFWRSAISPEQTVDEVNFIQEEFSVPVGSSLLDLACGNGRHSIELAKRGYAMTGVDLCSEFIAEARQLAIQNCIHLDLRNLDMRDISLTPTFDGAFCFGNSFGYMNHPDTMKFLQAVNQCLKQGANLIINTEVVAESLLPSLQTRRWHHVKDIFVVSENHYDAANGVLHTDYTFIRGAVVESGRATYCVYSIGELKRLLSHCGFATTALYTALDRRPFALGGQLLLTAVKIE